MSTLEPYLQRKSAALNARQQDFSEQPEKALISISAVSKVAGITGARPTKMGEFNILTDSAPGLAGHALGPTAPELLLGALASCLVHTYLIQATLMNLPLDHVEVEVKGKLDMAGVVGLPYTQPPQLQDIRYEARVQSTASAEAIEWMHKAVEETCPVLNTIRLPIEVRREG
jgi:uncharacterized OsmC-like protein